MPTPVDLSKLYEPHPFQARVHESTAKNKVIEAARRLGKSRVALWELIKTWTEVVQTPADPSLQPPFHAWIVAPSYPQSEQVWNELMAFIPKEWMRRPPNQEYKRIELNGQPGGRAWGLIEVKSAHDPDSLQTAGLDFLWVTEAQELHNRAFEKMRPMVNSPNRLGRAVWEGIPALWRDHSGPMPGARYVAGIDLGRKHDASVLWILDAVDRKGVYHQTWDAGEDWTQQREGMIYACKMFGVERVSVDATGMGGDIFSQALAEAGLPVEEYIFTEATRMHMLNSLAVAMERNNVTFPNEQSLVRELRAFQFLKKGNGKPRPDHPDGEHDDEIFALGMALLLCEEGSPESARTRSSGRMSYMPSSERQMGTGARMMRDAKLRRMEERWERSGVIF